MNIAFDNPFVGAHPIPARFSPDGRHLIVGTVFSLLYLFPDFTRVLRGTANATDIVQKLNIGEPVRDLLWDVHPYRVAFRTVRHCCSQTKSRLTCVCRSPAIRSSLT